MTEKQPIDYARAESADVIRKKFRRRVVMFVIVTVVVMGIGGGWVHAARGGGFSTGDFDSYWMAGMGSIIVLSGPEREDPGPENRLYGCTIGDGTVGVWLTQFNRVRFQKWEVWIRYRTLFILATIPWIITLIRMIRIWKRKRAVAQLTSDLRLTPPSSHLASPSK